MQNWMILVLGSKIKKNSLKNFWKHNAYEKHTPYISGGLKIKRDVKNIQLHLKDNLWVIISLNVRSISTIIMIQNILCTNFVFINL